MRTNLLKLVFPASTLAVAVFSAFSFAKADEKSLLAAETGWINLSGQAPCTVQVNCDNNPAFPLCTAIYQGVSHQAYGKMTPTSTTCTKLLYRAQ